MSFEKEQHKDLPQGISPSTSLENLSTWVEIDTQAFEHNLASYKKIIGSALLAPVVKSNAYGHGIEIIAKLCDKSLYVDIICVVSLSEALLLRSRGIKKPILVLSIIDNDLTKAISLDIALVIYDIETVSHINEIAESINKKASVHIKVDTGLSRLGVIAENALDLIKKVCELKNINIDGIFSHFADSENEDPTFANLQITRFNNLLENIENNNIKINLRHMTCSAAITLLEKSHHNLVRLGIGIYGLWPSSINKLKYQKTNPEFTLKPILTWKTKVIQIKKISMGSFIGYDRTFKAEQDMTIATLPIGYWDGYDRRLSNIGKVSIAGTIVPVIGRIAMNLTTIDITGLEVQIGQEVTLLGNHQAISAEDLASNCKTINYEIVTRINPLIPRVVK